MEKTISDLKYKIFEIIKSDKKKRIKNHEESLCEMWNIITTKYLYYRYS